MTALTLKRPNPRALSAALAGKLAAIIVTLTLVMALLVCSVGKAFAGPMPKMDVMVKGENIRLGDVFDGLTQNADFVLAPAPIPGQELVWNAPTLTRIATAFDLPWRPEGNTEVRIRRDANLVDRDTMRAVIRDYLASNDPESIYKITFNGTVPEVIAATDAPPIQLADFSMQEAGGTFTALMKVPGNDGKYETVTLHGAAERMIRLPVLKTGLKNGQIITPQNITWITLKANATRDDYISNIDNMVGATPRRSLNAGEIVRADALEMPRLVNRGDIVTMVFQQGGMRLTVKGRALDDGAMDEVIKVSNTGSNRTIEARVSANKEVTVN